MTRDGDGKFRLMFERSADAILLLDTTTNKFVEYNQATLDMLRCTREQLSALHPSELSPPTQPDGRDSFQSANERIATAVRAGSHRFEWMHRSPHREDFPVEVLLTPIQVQEAPMLLVVWRDITERKRQETALRQAQKLESMRVLAGGVAHDFNNLLTALSGHLSLAKRLVEPAHPCQAHLGQMELVVKKATALARQMLVYSGQGALCVETVELNALVREMFDLLTAATQSVRLELLPPAQPALPVEANAAELQQVVMNLVTNAAEASPKGARVRLSTRALELTQADLARDFAGQALQPGRFAVLEVEDEGAGMSTELLARVFDPFFSTKGAGRGLGLSALLGIVRSSRGGVSVKSQPGQGTRFTVALPLSPGTPRAAEPEPTPSSGRGQGTVLVVDDQVAIRRSAGALLESLGYSVLEADSGEAAVNAFRQHLGAVDWVLMDLTMPGMSGHEAFLAMRELDPAAKVILSSGWAEGELAVRFRADPPLAFLPKPYRLEELRGVLSRAGLLSP